MANPIFDTADHERVKQAVQQAESQTSAEIVPVVARSSGRYDRSEDIVGLWFAALAMIFVWVIYPRPTDPNDWDAPSPVWELFAFVVAMVVGFLVGAMIGMRVDVIRRLFTPRAQMREDVLRRAKEVFFDKRIHHTDRGSGVLVYVSLFERMAVIIADQSVLDKVGQPRLDEWCAEFMQRLSKGTPIDAICETIAVIGQQLSPLLPRTETQGNELADVLVELQ